MDGKLRGWNGGQVDKRVANFVWQTAVVGPERPRGRIHVADVEGTLVAVVADGAGDTAGAERAADLVVHEVEELAARDLPNMEWDRLLFKLDRKLQRAARAGETTAVVLGIHGDQIRGASVGDSAAWLINGNSVQNLTRHQERRPLVGSGVAYPVAFEARLGGDTLMLATNGLIKYARTATICEFVTRPDLKDGLDGLLASIQLPSGAWWADLGVVLCRHHNLNGRR